MRLPFARVLNTPSGVSVLSAGQVIRPSQSIGGASETESAVCFDFDAPRFPDPQKREAPRRRVDDCRQDASGSYAREKNAPIVEFPALGKHCIFGRGNSRAPLGVRNL